MPVGHDYRQQTMDCCAYKFAKEIGCTACALALCMCASLPFQAVAPEYQCKTRTHSPSPSLPSLSLSLSLRLRSLLYSLRGLPSPFLFYTL